MAPPKAPRRQVCERGKPSRYHLVGLCGLACPQWAKVQRRLVQSHGLHGPARQPVEARKQELNNSCRRGWGGAERPESSSSHAQKTRGRAREGVRASKT